jgi:hypothetical protein
MEEFQKQPTQLDIMVITLILCWLVCFTSKFKAGTLVLHVHMGLKVHFLVWISAWKYFYCPVSPVNFFSHVNSNKRTLHYHSVVLLDLFLSILSVCIQQHYSKLTAWSCSFRECCTGDNWRSQTSTSLQEKEQPMSNSEEEGLVYIIAREGAA